MTDMTQHGRRSKHPFVMVPQWVLLLKAEGGLTPGGFMLYALLLAHVNASRDDGRMWVTQETLGKMLDMHPNSVGRLINGELKKLGLVDVETHRYGDNNTRKRNVYTIHEIPPETFTGYESLSAWHRANRVEEGEPPTYLSEKSQVGPMGAGSEMSQSPDSTEMVGPDSTQRLSPEATVMVDKRDEAKTTLPPPPSSVGTRRDDEEEIRNAPAEPEEEPIEVTGDDIRMAMRLFGAVPWPSGVAVGTRKKKQIMDRLSMMAAGGWTEERIRDCIVSRIPDWKAVKRPVDLVASVLDDSPTRISQAFTAPVEPQDDDELKQAEKAARDLEIQHDQQKLVIADCLECDELGYVMPHGAASIEWHGHGKMSLGNEKRKAQSKVAQLKEERETGESPWEIAS